MEREGVIKMRKPLYLIVGPSGSGKDYIVDMLCNDLPNVSRVISRTTRPCRGPKDLHIFVDADTAGEEIPRSIARADYSGNLYYVLPEDIDDRNFYIVDPEGEIILLEQKKAGMPCLKDRDIFTFYIDAPWHVRVANMVKRGDKVSSIIKRLMVDRVRFRNYEGDINVKSSYELYDFFMNM